MKSFMNFLRDNLKKKFIVFGTGSFAEQAIEYIPVNIAYFVDNNSKLWGNDFHGKGICNPATLLNEDKHDIVIVVFSTYFPDISVQLTNGGFEENHHFFDGNKILKGIWNSKQQIFLEYPVHCKPRYEHSEKGHELLYNIINQHREKYEFYLREFLHYEEKIREINLISANDDLKPAWINGYFSGLDSISLYSFINILKPATYLEIGSGNSTKFAKQSIADGNLQTRIISIDPCPRNNINILCDEVIRKPLEDVDVSYFNQLEENDILFFDGSHRAFMNSDATAFFMDIIPNLRPGVIVHIHDIFLPNDYPQGWEDLYYSEQYLLGCYLLGGSEKFEVLFPSNFILNDAYLSSILTPLWDKLDARIERQGASFWLKIK